MTIAQWLVDMPRQLAMLNVAVAATLACAVAMVVARIIKSTALRHAILLSSLLLVLLSPLVVGISGTGYLGLLTVELSDTSSRQIGQLVDTGVGTLTNVDREKSVPLSIELKRNKDEHGAASTAGNGMGIAPASKVGDTSPSADVEAPALADHTAARPPWWRLLGAIAAVGWFLGGVVAAARLAKGYCVVLRLGRSLRVASAEIQRFAQHAAEQVGLRETPGVFESSFTPAPLIVGFWRPIVVVPFGIERQSGAKQLEGMLVHETAHIARRDQWVGLLQRMVTVLFWRQPLVHRLNSRLSAVREDLCDNYVIWQHGLAVRDIGSDRNHDGIRLSGLDDFRVENCTVERWGKKGSGIDMVGCHRGAVTGSTFREGDKMFGNAVQMKGGSRDITVSFCRVENAGGRAINIGGSTGPAYFRPKPDGYEAKDIVVEDCEFIGSMAPIAFVGVDGAVVRHNTIYRPPAFWRCHQRGKIPALPMRSSQETCTIRRGGTHET